MAYTVAFSADQNGSIIGSTSQVISDGGSCTVVYPVANYGYIFSGWSGDYTGADNPLVISGVSSDMDIVAVFSEDASYNALWFTQTSGLMPLHREDAFAFDLLDNKWASTNGIPKAYSVVTQPTQTIDVMPPTSINAILHAMFTDYSVTLSNTGVELAMPDEFSPYIKWGLLEMMLSEEGPAHDPVRATYCSQRFQEGVELANLICGDNLYE